MTVRGESNAKSDDAAAYRPPLFRRFPELEEAMPRLAFGLYPTPVGRLRNLEHGNLWIKREDLSSRLYGGNKVRKLEFVLGDALRKKCKLLITMGGLGTNHGLASAIFCREAGIRCRLLLFNQPMNRYVRQNMLLFKKYGAELVYCGGALRTGAALLVAQRIANPRAYILEAGGSSPVGVTGIVNAMLELKDQIDAGLLPEPNYLFCPLGSNGTMAGLSLGALIAGLSTAVIGVRVTMEAVGPVQVATPKTVESLMRKTLRLLKKRCRSVPDIAVPGQRVIGGYLGDGYGCATEGCMEAIAIMKEREGISLDPTYTAKTVAALLDFIKLPEHRDEPVLYWHTYNSVDLSEQAASVDWRELPPPLRRIYETGD